MVIPGKQAFFVAVFVVNVTVHQLYIIIVYIYHRYDRSSLIDFSLSLSLLYLTCRSKEEMYRYLSIDIGHDNLDQRDPSFVKPAVDSCLANFFSPEDREVNCEKCKVGKIATQTMNIISKPKVMLLHLKRFIAVERPIAGTNDSELIFKKNKIPVELTTTLSIDKLLTKNNSKNDDNNNKSVLETTCALPSTKEYRLKSVVHHIGNTANSGHYTTDALRANPDDDGNDQWVFYDDGVTAERSLERVVQTAKNQKTAYMLMYSLD